MGLLDDFGVAIHTVLEPLIDAVDRAREARRARLRAIAAEVGLEVDEKGRFTGRYGGVPVIRWSQDRGGKNRTEWWTNTIFQLQAPLPGFLVVRPKQLLDGLGEALGAGDIRLGIPEDDALWVRAEARQHDAARALLTAGTVHERMAAILDSGLQWNLAEDQLKLSFRGHHERAGARGLELGTSVVRAINAESQRGWHTLGRRMGCPFEPERRLLEGHLDGVPLRIEAKVEKTRWTTWIVARFSPALPVGTSVVHRDRLPKGLAIGDPILDPMVRAETVNLDALRFRLARDAVRPPLLEVVHGFPGSELRADRVVLRIAGHVGPLLERRVGVAIELARALSEP